MAQFTSVFSTGRIGNMEIKNRLMMASMVRNYADDEGRVTPKYLAHIESIARGGVGALILEASFIRQDGKGFVNELGIHDDSMIDGLRKLVSTAHAEGAVIGPQLYHAGRQTSSMISGVQPVSPSALPDPTISEIPRALSKDEIVDVVNAFADGARRAKEAGCDFVEIHGAHGYLITQFLSPFSNWRDDEYGGSLENRMRFMDEVVLAVRRTVGDDFPIIVRLSGAEMVPGGLMIEDTVAIAKHLQQLGVNAVHISAGNYASYELGYMIQPMAVPDGPLLPLAQAVKAEVDIPVISVGKIRSPQMADDVISTGTADFVALGRSLLADPDWPNKARDGRVDEIDKCIACNQGCISRLFEQQDVWCTVNPQTARELEFAIPAPDRKLRVLIAGGGPAGMSAAKVAAGRGHQVILCEKSDRLGGQLFSASAAPHRPGWEELREYLVGEMDRLDIDVRLGTEVTADLVKNEQADLAVIAVGSFPFRPDIPGVTNANVVTARDVLEGHAQAAGRVIVAGGGCAGAQTAEFLADKGLDVTIVESLGSIAIDAPRADRELLLARLQNLGVDIVTDTRILSIEEGRIGVQDPQGLSYMDSDTVVLCLGSVPSDGLVDNLIALGIEVVVIGDAADPRKVTEAMVEGALVGLYAGGQEQKMAA